MKKIVLAGAICAILAGCSESQTDALPSSGDDGQAQTDNGSDTGTGNGSGGDTTDAGQNGGADAGDGTGGGDQAGGDTSGDGTGETGGGDASGGESGGGTTDGGTTDGGDLAACTSTDVGIAFQSVSATVVSDPGAAPAELVDGCVDREHSWSGDTGSIVTLDAGAVHQMQGVYVWSTFARMEWIKIESSADGLSWVTDWQAVPTKPVAGPVYYGLSAAGSTRYVRVTGFGSDLNSWTNIAEVRWSLSGYNVAGERVEKSGNHVTFSNTNQAFETLSSQLIGMSLSPYSMCPMLDAGASVNATGALDSFHKLVTLNGRDHHLIDWDHYPLGLAQNSAFGTHNESYFMINSAQERVSALLDPAVNTQEQLMNNCLPSGAKDQLWVIDEEAVAARG